MDAAYAQINRDTQIKEARLLAPSAILINTSAKTITIPASSYVYNVKENNFSAPNALPVVIDYSSLSSIFCLFYSYTTKSFGICAYNTSTTNIITDGVYFLGLFYGSNNPICNFHYTINNIAPIADASISKNKLNFNTQIETPLLSIPFKNNITGVLLTEVKGFIIDADLSDYSSYNNTLYYSFSEIIDNGSSLTVKLFSATSEIGSSPIAITSFVYTGNLLSKNPVVLTSYGYGRIIIIPSNWSLGSKNGLWNTLSSLVFSPKYSNISDYLINKDLLNIRYPVLWINTGKYLNSLGQLANSGSHITSDFIELWTNSINIRGYFSGTIPTRLCLYDEQKTFLGYVNSIVEGYTDSVIDLSLFSTAKYARMYTAKSYYSDFIVSFNAGKSIKVLYDKINNVTYTNQFAIPSNIDAVINRQMQIWLDGVSADINLEKTGSFIITSSNAALRVIENALRYEPSVATPNISVTIKKTDNNLVEIYSSVFNIRTISKSIGNGSVSKNILLCGDSLVENSNLATTVYALLEEDGDFVINQLGTYGPVGGKHEGRGGWSWSSYVNPLYESTPYSTKTNAFMHNGVLDFQNYCTANSYSGIDYFFIALGTNDVTQGTSLQNATSIATIIANAKIFIDALLSSDKGYPNCKIAIGLPAVGAPVFSSTANADIFRKSIQMLNKAYITTFDNGVYHANVTTVMHGAYIDRVNSYQYTDVVRSTRTTSSTIREYINNVHPSTIGYQQWADGVYAKLRSFMSGLL